MSNNQYCEYFDSDATEKLKEYYQSHDFTGHVVGYDASNSTPERDRIFAKAKKFCALAWIDQLSAIGVKYRQKNYSESYPLRCLSDANGDYIAGQVADIISDPQKFNAILDTFFVRLQPVLDAGFTSLANSLKMPVEELTGEEIHAVVDAAAQMYMESMIQALALAQQAPEIAGVAKKNASHSDFNKSIADNHDKIDFDRKWNHTRTKLGAPLSLEALAASDPSALEEGHSMFETNDEEYDRLENQFLDTLNSTDREIYLMRKQGLTQAEIAERLGYKTHSAVTKRMEKMKKALIDFCADFDN